MGKIDSGRVAALAARDAKPEKSEDNDEPKERLHTYIKPEQNRRLAHRAADKLGSKLQQTSEAITLYLAIYDDGPLSPEMRRAIERRLQKDSTYE